jgi:hypothetical protein
MNFPLCQIFSVLLMGICAPWLAPNAGYGRGLAASMRWEY